MPGRAVSGFPKTRSRVIWLGHQVEPDVYETLRVMIEPLGLETCQKHFGIIVALMKPHHLRLRIMMVSDGEETFVMTLMTKRN